MCAPGGVCYSQTNVYIIINVFLHTTEAVGGQPSGAAAVMTIALDDDGNPIALIRCNF